MSDTETNEDLERLYARVRADVQKERGVRAWLRSRSTGARTAVLLVIASISIAAPALLMGGLPLVDGAGARWIGSVVGVAVLVVAAIGLSLRPLHRDPAPTGAWLAALAIAALGSMVLASDGSAGEALAPRCLMLGAMVGAPVFAAGFLVDRAPRRNLALAGMAASLTGMAAAQLLCPLRGLGHLIVDHFGALLLLAAAFAALRWGLARVEDALRARGA